MDIFKDAVKAFATGTFVALTAPISVPILAIKAVSDTIDTLEEPRYSSVEDNDLADSGSDQVAE